MKSSIKLIILIAILLFILFFCVLPMTINKRNKITTSVAFEATPEISIDYMTVDTPYTFIDDTANP